MDNWTLSTTPAIYEMTMTYKSMNAPRLHLAISKGIHEHQVGQTVQFLLYILTLNRDSCLYGFTDNIYNTVELLSLVIHERENLIVHN